MVKKRGLRSEAWHIALEVMLILASVLIFRSAWLLLDSAALLNTVIAYVVMLVVGLAVTLVAVNLLLKHMKHH